MEIRKMNGSDIAAVCAIHRQVLPTVTARMGHLFLEFFYKTLANHPLLHHALVATQGKTIIGVITATCDAKHTQGLLSPILRNPKALRQLVSALFQRRVTIGELYERIFTEREILAAHPHPYQTILTLCIDQQMQRKGVGSKLLVALERHLDRGTDLYVDTEVKNRPAQSFYTAAGFQKVALIRSSVVFAKTIAKQPASRR